MKRWTALAGLAVLGVSATANAAVSDEEFQKMQEQLGQALERISELEQQEAVVDNVQQAEVEAVAATDAATAEQVAENTAKLEKMSWAERLRWQGDFRYRYQPEEAKGLLPPIEASRAPEVSRNRQRIRARAALIADLTDNLEVGFGLSTGGDNPVSANATLGGSGAKPEINLDLAYFDWEFVGNANLAAGRFKNPTVDVGKTALLWDGDWRPEGFDLRYKGEVFYVSALGTWLAADNSSGSGNSFNYGGQLGFAPKFGIAKLDIGAGYWKIKSETRECYDDDGGVGDNCFGNTQVDAAGTVNNAGDQFYLMDYAPAQAYAKLGFGTSVAFGFFADFIKNVDAKAIVGGPSNGKKLDTAYAAGAWLGAGKKKGEWQVKAYYQDKEADSVLGILTDSDFGGGGTDSKGYVAEAKYMLTGNTYLQAKYLAAERQDSNGYENGDAATSNPYDVNVLQLDVQFKYK